METKLVKLGKVAKYIKNRVDIDCSNSGEYVSTENLQSNKFGVSFPSSSYPASGKVGTYQTGDILISNIRPYFKKIWQANKSGTYSPDVLNIRATSATLTQDFLAVVLSDDRFFNFMVATSKGTKMPRGDKQAIMQYEFILPKLTVQQRVVHIIKTIDVKIELNQQINENLLRLMNVQWKNMFGSLNAENGHFTDLATVAAGGTPSKKQADYFGGDISWITPKDMSLTNDVFIERGLLNITEAGLRGSSAKLLPKGTLLFSSRAPIGYLGIAANPVTTNQGFKSLVPKRNENTEYLYFLLKNLTPYIEGIAGGSTFKEISGAGMKSVEFPLPTDNQIDAFHNIVTPMFDMVRNNEQQNKKLTDLRDLLLPRLLAGDIDLSNIETVMNNA
ncbi:restriction endonuclease subunit S [Limosilactobacillus fermentum]|uniref:restriction endonuclease subunit S n=1 Tax=Limosilactobacillus fermentum TaxID=1613 RepID=UPI00290F1184|nr:restriction endonuclease subunit S [Limosilactobacillus fermentum]